MSLQLDINMPNGDLHVDVIAIEQCSVLSLASVMRTLECLNDCLHNSAVQLRQVIHSRDVHDLWLLNTRRRSTLPVHLKTLHSNPQPHLVFLVCGNDIPSELRESTLKLIRTCARLGIPLAGIGAASWAFSEAGILEGKTCAIHWASNRAFAERNLATDVVASLYETTGKIATCAGETATLDFTLDLISHNFGFEVAKKIRNQLLMGYQRSGATPQPGALENRLQHYPDVLRNVVRDMVSNIENPLCIGALSKRHKISQRHLERLFVRNLGTSPRKYYRALQTELAYQLCEQTDMGFLEIALASGFGSTASLNKAMQECYGTLPKQLRAQRTHSHSPIAAQKIPAHKDSARLRRWDNGNIQP